MCAEAGCQMFILIVISLMFPIYKLLLENKASTLPTETVFHLLFEVPTPVDCGTL